MLAVRLVLVVALLALSGQLAHAAIGSGGTLGTATGSASATSLALTTATNTLASGDYGLLITSFSGAGTVSSVAGCTGTWTHLGTRTDDNDGATVSAWLLAASATCSTGTTVTVTYGASVSQRSVAMWKFTVAAGKILALDTSAASNPITSSVVGNDYGSVTFSGLASRERLYYRAGAKRQNTTSDLTPTTNFTSQGLTIRPQNNAATVILRAERRITTSTGETSNPSRACSVSGSQTCDTPGLFFAFVENDPPAGHGPLLGGKRNWRVVPW